MGVIKTALEIALEKTESVKSDKSGIYQYEINQKGKKLANEFLAGDVNLSSEIKKTPESQRLGLKQGVFDILVTQITLPINDEGQNRLEKAGKGLAEVIGKSEFTAMFRQLLQLTGQYLQELSQYDQAIKQQYAPKLRQKEEELGRRLGREISINPMQDPEFVAFYNQNMNALKSNYEGIIEQAKSETKRLFEK